MDLGDFNWQNLDQQTPSNNQGGMKRSHESMNVSQAPTMAHAYSMGVLKMAGRGQFTNQGNSHVSQSSLQNAQFSMNPPPQKKVMKPSDFIAMQKAKSLQQNSVSFSQDTKLNHTYNDPMSSFAAATGGASSMSNGQSSVNLLASMQSRGDLNHYGHSMSMNHLQMGRPNAQASLYPQQNSTFTPKPSQLPKPFSRFLPKLPSESGKKAKLEVAAMDSDSLLHNSCKLYSDNSTVVESAMQFDPDAVRRPVPIVCYGNDKEKVNGEKFAYPLNIALKYNASREVLELLLAGGPDVIAMPDGPDKAGTLSLALMMQRDIEDILLILRTNPMAVRTKDRHKNYPLHACVRSPRPSLEVVKLIYESYPAALNMSNFHGKTPVDLAVHSPFCGEDVLDFLQSKQYEQEEINATHM